MNILEEALNTKERTRTIISDDEIVELMIAYCSRKVNSTEIRIVLNKRGYKCSNNSIALNLLLGRCVTLIRRGQLKIVKV